MDSTGATGSASYQLKDQPAVVSIFNTVAVGSGEMRGNVYLNMGATGGSFRRADVVRVSPAHAGTALIIEGEIAALSLVKPKGLHLKFTPDPLFAGTAHIEFTLTSALGVSNAGVVTYMIALDRHAVAAG
jgi:hypothetical protein